MGCKQRAAGVRRYDVVCGPWVVGTLTAAAQPTHHSRLPYTFGTLAVCVVVMRAVALCCACCLVLGMACLATGAVRLESAAT